MADIYNVNSNSMMHVGIPFNYKRGEPIPIDDSQIYPSYEAAAEYAKNSALAYAGQVIGVVPAGYSFSEWTFSDQAPDNEVTHVVTFNDETGKWSIDGTEATVKTTTGKGLVGVLSIAVGEGDTELIASRTLVLGDKVRTFVIEADGSLTELADKESVSAIAGILGDLDSEALENIQNAANAVASKMDKLTKEDGAPDFTGNLAKFDDKGQVIDSGEKISDYAKTSYVNTELDKKATKTELTEAISGVNAEVAEKLDIETAESDYLKKTDGKVTIDDTATPGDGIAKVYTIKQGETTVGTINIPKDLVVQSGSVITATAEDTGCTVGEKYIKLAIANQTAPIYIAVKDLVDVYTEAKNATEVQLSISDTNEISATIVNGSITKEKLHSSVQASLDKADAAAVKSEVDTALGTINETLEDHAGRIDALEKATTLDDAKAYTDAEIQKLDADLDATGTAEKGGTFVVSGITQIDGKITAVDSIEVETAGAAAAVKDALEGESTDTKDSKTIEGAKKYADSIVAPITDALEVLNGTGVGSVDKKIADAISGLDSDLDASVASMTETDSVAVVSGITTTDGKITSVDSKEVATPAQVDRKVSAAKDAVIGTSTDASSADTIKGAKKYAEEKASAAESAAKAYTDEVAAKTYLGTTTTDLSASGVTSTISVGGKEVTAVVGSMAIYNGSAYIWSGTEWVPVSKHTTELSLKADKTYVDTELAKKADKTTTEAELAKKIEGAVDKDGNAFATDIINGSKMIVINNLILDGGSAVNNVA